MRIEKENSQGLAQEKKDHVKSVSGFCPICKQKSVFISDHEWLRDNYRCMRCHSIPRQRHIQHILSALVPDWDKRNIHEASPHTNFVSRYARNYSASQYYPDKPLGAKIGNFTNENLESLTFADDSFDIFLSQDVLEHVFDPQKAIREMLRVVRPTGYVMFTVPVFNRESTIHRATLGENGCIIHLEAPVYHGNPVDDKGSLAVWDYGYDLIDRLKEWAEGNEVDFYNQEYPELGIEAMMLGVFVIRKLT